MACAHAHFTEFYHRVGSINSTEVQPGPIYYCQKQSDVNKEIENYAISLPERRNDSIMYLNLCSGVHALTTNADTERVTHRNRATHQNTLGSHTILLIALNVIMCNIIPAIV